MRVVEARALPANPVDAAAAFASIAAQVRTAMAGEPAVCVVFDAADHTHIAWRRAAIQGLAREAAPGRVNGIAGSDPAALAATLRYLDAAPGVTGQYLPLDGRGAGDPAA